MMDDSLDDFDIAKFVFSLKRGDLSGSVARAQIHVQDELKKFIIDRAPSPKHVSGEMEFESVVRLALILGLSKDVKQSLTTLKMTRDKLAQMVRARFDHQDARNFYNTLPPYIKGIIHEEYSGLKSQHNLVEFKRQEPEYRLAHYLIGIWTVVSTERKLGPTPWRIPRHLPDNYIKDLEDRKLKFIALLEGKSDLEMVIQAHTHLHHELEEFVLAAAPQADEVRLRDFDFYGLLSLCLILGLEPSLAKPLKAISALRNRFAHELEISLREIDAQRIFLSLDASTRTDAATAWSVTHRKHPHTGRPPMLKDAKPADVLATSAVMLYQSIVLGHLTLRSAALRKDR
jgi:hypothetical protein